MSKKRRVLKLALAIGLPIATVLACSGSDSSSGLFTPSVSGCTPTTDSVEKTIFGPKCATVGCHTGANAQADLDLGSPGVDGRLVGHAATQCAGKTLVVAGDPSASYLVDKLGTKPSCGASMPSGGPALDPTDVACIRNWIAGINPGSVDGGGSSSGGTDGGGTTSCAPGTTACGTACVDTATDPKNCGTCGTTCAVACSSGACVSTCPTVTPTNCSGSCVDLKTSNTHCGTCTTDCTASGKVCNNGACSCGTTSTTLTQVQSQIFSPTCAVSNCHTTTVVGKQTIAPQAGLDLSAGKSYGQLVGVPSSGCSGEQRVVAGNVSASLLMQKLTNTQPAGCGSQMPKKGQFLATAQLDMVRSWICNGAANN